ncbi:hypothetical protein SELMODRAFT_414652 [Selaginella moellendorffii]|uniref:DnaJ homologue subfamily C GRV2/DNAJC13 N-terminal domain-containing protein n=1 Tax=Selaginella moellendorffii TaxID=88036 RepID=D8RTH2_SELML|nr:hypothetical protein SELMODRAFT_414652 [Selaginella moellendorffii]
MDYQLFCIRISGGVFGHAVSRAEKVLRVFESCLSISSLTTTHNGATAASSSVEFMFESISNVLPSTKDDKELTLNVPDGSGRGYETLHIYCDSRSELMTTLLNRMDDLNGIGTDFSLKKHSHESGGLVERVLRVRSASIVKMQSNGSRHERRRVNPAKKINFNDIVKVQTMADDDHIVLLHLHSRMLRLSITDASPFLLALSRNMKFYLNRELDTEKITTSKMVDNIAAYIKQVKALPFLYEFHVMKQSESNAQERKRSLYISREHFVEMAGDEVVAFDCLKDIIGLIVNDKNANEIVVEFKSSRSAQYFFEDRENFIASIADVAATSKSSFFDVRPVPFFRLMFPRQFEYEALYINRLMLEFNGKRDPAVLHITLKEFASNVHVGKSQCTDYRVVCAVAELLKDCSRICFDSLKNMSSIILVLMQCLRSENAVLVYNAFVALKFAFKYSGDVYADPSALKQEQFNKLIVLSLENMQQFATWLHTYCLKRGHLLQAYATVKLLSAGLDNLVLETDTLRAWMKAFESSIMVVGDVLCVLSRSKKSVLRESTATLLEALLAKTSSVVSSHFRGAFQFYDLTASKLLETGKDKSASHFCAWVKLLDVLRRDTIETPLFIWNDMKRTELMKFLEKEMQGFSAAAATNHVVSYNHSDISFTYSAESEGQGTVVEGIHLELLVDHSPPADGTYAPFWKVQSPLALFQAVFQSLILGFTPFFGHNNTPEVDLRLAVHVLTKLYERYALEVTFCLQTSNVIEASVGMLQEVMETEHQANLVLHNSVAKKSSILETVEVVGMNGELKLVRVPSGKVREVLGKALLNGSLDAKEAIKWQDSIVPSKIQFGMVLDVLEAILRLCGSDNSDIFPPSAACIALSREDVMCHLVQSLLRAKTPAFGRILNILSHLTKTSKSCMTSIEELGTYEIILWKLLAGDIVDADKKMIISFLRQTHLPQVSDVYLNTDCSPCENSSLRFYLPDGLIMKLISEDAEGFFMLLNSEQNNPEVVWNVTMAEALLSQLTCHLEPYVRNRAADAMALYIHVPVTVVYEELADAVYTEPFYLHNFLDTERFSNYPINDPVKFLNNLMKHLRQLSGDFLKSTSNGMASSFWMKGLSKSHQLLSSLAYLLERFPKLVPPSDIEAVALTLATPAVRYLAELEGVDLLIPEIMFQATKILREMCAITVRDTGPLTGAVDFALNIISLGADGSSADYRADTLSNVITGALSMLEVTCGSRAGRDLLRDDSRWNRGLWWALCTAIGDPISSVVPAELNRISSAALSCLRHFVEQEELPEFFKKGLHLPLILLTFFSVNEGGNSAMTLLAVDIMRCLDGNEFSSSLLRRVIPEPLLVSLTAQEGIERLAEVRASHFALPTALWDDRVRGELRERLYDRLHNRNSEDDELEWLRQFSYNCLRDELVIDGFYIKGLISCNTDSIKFQLRSSLLNALLGFMVRHRSVALDGVNRDTDKISVTEYLSVLSAFKECIRYALKKNMTEMLTQCDYSGLSSLIFQGVLDYRVQVGISSVCKVLVAGGLLELVFQSQLLGALSLQLWEASADVSKEGMDDVLRSTLEALYVLSEQLPATTAATNYFSSHGTFLPLMAMFCDVNLPCLRGSGASAKNIRSFGHRLMAAKILGQLLLAGKGVTRRGKLIKDLEQQKTSSGEGIGQATDMYELFSIVENCSEDDPAPIRSLLLLLPLEILSALAREPTEACKTYDGCVLSVKLVWDESRRHQVKTIIMKEAARVRTIYTNAGGLSAWSVDAKRPVFLRWILAVNIEGDERPLFRHDFAEGYAQELYLGGYYVDQFLRGYKHSLDPVSQERLLHELRKALVVGSSTDGLYAEAFTFDDRRRVLLALLILVRLHPHLLSSRSNIDIFLPLYELMSNDLGDERRAFAQPAMLLLHCTATHPDIADCIISEELLYTLASFLSLKVPPPYAGDTGTDPRLCSLSLLLRLMRLSSITVEIVMRMGVISKIEDLLLDFHGSEPVKKKAAECLAMMCADKRKGGEVRSRLDKLIPSKVKGYGAWKLHVNRIQDNIVEMASLDYFLQHRQPSPWWTSDTPEGTDQSFEEAGAVAVIEGSLCFTRARMSDFNNEAEIVFIRSIASTACVELSAVRIVRKRLGSVTVDFEVTFRKQSQERAEISANSFKEMLQVAGNDFFANTLLESMGPLKVTSISLKPVDLYRQKSWQNGSAPSVGDKNVIYVAKEQKPDASSAAQPASLPSSPQSSSPSALSPSVSFSKFLVPSALPPSSPSPKVEKVLVSQPVTTASPLSKSIQSGNGVNGHGAHNGNGHSTMLSGNGHSTMANGNGHSSIGNGKNHAITDGPVVPVEDVLLAMPEALPSTRNIMITSEEGRLVSLDEGLELVLEGAEISKENRRVAKTNFLDAFEDDMEELGKILEKYSKLVQKFPLQPQARYGRSIASYDICRTDNPEVAIQEAKRKEQEWKEKSKQLKGDMSAELARAVGERKERLSADVAKDELKAMSKGKIQRKKKQS